MKELFIYRGLPGSGKTTRAKKLQQNIGACLVGRDHLRELLFGKFVGLTRQQENEITKVQERLIRDALRNDQPVIVDDLNLRQRDVRRFMEIAHEEGAEFSVIDLTDVPLDTCMWQNDNRDRKVPDGVITELHKKFIADKAYPLPLPKLAEKPSGGALYAPDEDAPKAIIVDIDGTVALMNGRSPYDYTQVQHDTENTPVTAIVWMLYRAGYKILFTSGRPDSCRQATADWLFGVLGLTHFELFMRNTGDSRNDAVVKQELFDRHIRHEYNVEFVLDDRNRVVDMWRSLGLTCLQVAEGNF